MNEAIHITFHHGSPGHSADFDALIRLLPSDWMFNRRCRHNPREQFDASGAAGRSSVIRVAVGWSFGAVLALESLDRREVDLALLICPWLRTTTQPALLLRYRWLSNLVRSISSLLIKKHVRRTLAGRPDLWAAAQKRWGGSSLVHALQEKTRESPGNAWVIWKRNRGSVRAVIGREDHLFERLRSEELQCLAEMRPKIISGPHGLLMTDPRAVADWIRSVLIPISHAKKDFRDA